VEHVAGAALSVLAALVVLWLFILVPAGMARARGRGALVWVLISLTFSPLLAILLLVALGDAPDRG
jgi:hypothetical protein